MSYEERKYRSLLNEDRFSYFRLMHLETDLWIGVGKEAKLSGNKHEDSWKLLHTEILKEITLLRDQIESFIDLHPEFRTSYTPLSYAEKPPPYIRQLLKGAEVAGTGPMAGIAGLFSEYIGKKLHMKTSGAEVLVENGGDIFISTKTEMITSIFAGDSPLSNKMALKIPKGQWGVCTSSGTVGHSLSFGKADAVTVVSKSTVLADALATQIANQVQSPADIKSVLENSRKYKGIEGVVIICKDKMGIDGALELVPVL